MCSLLVKTFCRCKKSRSQVGSQAEVSPLVLACIKYKNDAFLASASVHLEQGRKDPFGENPSLSLKHNDGLGCFIWADGLQTRDVTARSTVSSPLTFFPTEHEKSHNKSLRSIHIAFCDQPEVSFHRKYSAKQTAPDSLPSLCFVVVTSGTDIYISTEGNIVPGNCFIKQW